MGDPKPLDEDQVLGILEVVEVIMRNQMTMLNLSIKSLEEGSLTRNALEISKEELEEAQLSLLALFSERKAFP